MRWLAALAILALVANAAGVAPARSAEGSVGGEALVSVTADFVQEKHLKILARPIRSTGTFAFRAPQSLRWEYREPVRSVLLMDGGVVRKFVEHDGVLAEERGIPTGPLQLVMSQIGSWLSGDLEETPMFSVDTAVAGKVRLIPKDAAMRNVIEEIELTLGDRPGLLETVLIREGPESYTLMSFHGQVLNGELPASVFTEP